jgi:ubiquinone biosynthesis protein Coq4
VKTELPLPSRIYAQAAAVRTLMAQIQEPSPERVLALERHLTSLARPEDVDRYLGALRACPATQKMLEERYLPAPYALDELERCAPGSLGHAYRRHMIDNDLRPDFFAPIDPADDFAYTRLRFYQTHDLWHVVTGYPTSVLGEAGIVGFYLGHQERHLGDRAGPVAAFSAILAGGLILHGALFRPERLVHFLRAIVEGWHVGRAAAPFFAVRWEQMWDRPLDEIRSELGVARADALPLAA